MENNLFKIHSDYKPTGDQPTAIDSIVKNIENGVKDQVLLGVTGSGKTFTIANVIERVQRPALIIAPNKTLAAQLYSEYKKFFPENAVEYFVSYYDYYQPEAYIKTTDTYIEKDSSVNDEIDKLRNAATAALIHRRDVIIVASVSSIYGLGSPDTYRRMTIPIDKQTGISRKELMKRLIALRYDRNDVAFERGQFRIKGDVIDIYPSYMSNGYRLEYWGDDLEEISEINTLTGQKVKKNLERIVIYPATQYLTADDDKDRIIQEIKDDLKVEVKKFEDDKKLLEAQRLRQRTEYDLEMITEIGYCKGIENYSRYLSGKKPGETPDTLFEYFPKDFLLFIDESHITVPQVRGMYNGDRARKESLVENGFRLKAALDNRPLRFEEFREKSNQTVFISATPGDFEVEVSDNHIAEQLIRPTGIVDPEIEIRPTKNQVDDLLDEIRKRVAKKERVLVTTLTKKIAEELTEYYIELGVKVKYMHSDIDTLERIEIIRALRKGEIDVIIGINLLREGLDIPEVSLVAIMEADKEGFLRSRRSLVQTIGRAARNVEGRVILYADIMTDSMKEAITETERRRKIQKEYNAYNHIDPKSIIKEIAEDLINLDYGIEEKKFENDKKVFRNKTDIEKEYLEYLEVSLRNINETNGGYFSVDNSTKDEDIQNEVDQILKDKEKLLSFKDKNNNWNIMRFIFSKWTLREGWDNPNVFQIVKLRSSGSEISKLQEVGRGLRLPVDEYGNRVDNEEFYLTYLIDFTEKDFANKLIEEINFDGNKILKISDELLLKVAKERNKNDLNSSLYIGKGLRLVWGWELSGEDKVLSDIDYSKFTNSCKIEIHGCLTAGTIPGFPFLDNFCEDLSEYLYKAGKENSVVIGHSTKANPNINGDKTKNEEQDYRHGKRKVFNNGNVILEVVKKGRITGLEIKEALNKR